MCPDCGKDCGGPGGYGTHRAEKHNDAKYFDGVELKNLSEDDIAALAPRRKYLLEYERVLGVQLPATRKTHKGDNWRKATPNITNKDLKLILASLLEELEEEPEYVGEHIL